MTSPRETEPGPPTLPLLVTAALSGAAVMCIELSAVRLLAPWFGTSLPVWTNVIAVVLLGLSIGYLFGARASLGERPARTLALVLGVGAAATAWLPFLAGPVAELFLPDELDLEAAASIFGWGSLATSLVLFLPGAAVLGCVGPLVVELLGRTGLHAGEAGGRVLFASTLGSLVGVFGTSHWAVPTLGLRGTLLAAALCLVVGLVLVLAAARPGARTAAPLVLALLGGLATPEARALPEGSRLLAQAESPYQRVRVVQADDVRFLAVNESTNSYQSVWQAEPGLLGGDYYYNDFALPAAWTALDEPARGAWSVLCLGMGAGTARRVLDGTLPAGWDLDFHGVELDPEVLRLGRELLDLDERPGDLLLGGLDARGALRGLTGPYDQVIVDAYANQVELPAHLVTVEFFAEVRARLTVGGWCQVNVGGSDTRDPLVQAVMGSMARGLDAAVLCQRVPGTRNLVLTARREARPPLPTLPRWLELPGPLRDLLRGRQVRGQWELWEADGPVDLLLTDDRAPVEELQARSLAHSRAKRESSP